MKIQSLYALVMATFMFTMFLSGCAPTWDGQFIISKPTDDVAHERPHMVHLIIGGKAVPVRSWGMTAPHHGPRRYHAEPTTLDGPEIYGHWGQMGEYFVQYIIMYGDENPGSPTCILAYGNWGQESNWPKKGFEMPVVATPVDPKIYGLPPGSILYQIIPPKRGHEKKLHCIPERTQF